MVKPTLQQVFGANATQTATTITITKADLPTLTASASNTAESILVALILKSSSYLTQTNFDSNTDQSTYLANGYPSFANRGTDNTQYRVDQVNINLSKIDTASIIDADDY